MQVSKSWTARFIDWFPTNTRLYIRKKRGHEAHFARDEAELAEQLKPFFEKLRAEAVEASYREGYQKGLHAAKSNEDDRGEER